MNTIKQCTHFKINDDIKHLKLNNTIYSQVETLPQYES